MFIESPRLECRGCGRVRTMALPQVSAGKNHTKSFARLMVDLRKLMTGADVAEYLGVSDRMVRDIEKL